MFRYFCFSYLCGLMLLKFLEFSFLRFHCIWKFSAVNSSRISSGPFSLASVSGIAAVHKLYLWMLLHDCGCSNVLPPPQHSHTHFLSIGVAMWALSIERSLNSPILFSLCRSYWWTCQKHCSSLVIMFFIPSVVGRITFLEDIHVLISRTYKFAMLYDDLFCSGCCNTLP